MKLSTSNLYHEVVGMTSQQSHNHRSSWLLRILVPLLGSDMIELITALLRLVRKIIRSRANEGMYEVLNLESRLELRDPKGSKAVLYKKQKVRFLQDNIIAFQDKAWGDGEIFADYKCSPGAAVDRYREGHRFHVLISLRQTMNRGDSQEFNIERTIKNGFRKDLEDFQTEIDHPTKKMSVSVVFPRKRPPSKAWMIEQNATRTTELGPEHRQSMPDGRQQITWSINKPRLFEAYILRWSW